MTEPNPRRAEELRLDPSAQREEGVSESERAALLRGASASYLESIREEARAWELVSRALGELSRAVDPETLRHDAVLGLLRMTRMQRGGGFVLRDDGAGMSFQHADHLLFQGNHVHHIAHNGVVSAFVYTRRHPRNLTRHCAKWPGFA